MVFGKLLGTSTFRDVYTPPTRLLHASTRLLHASCTPLARLYAPPTRLLHASYTPLTRLAGKLLGSGTFGDVYKGKWLGSEVAIKGGQFTFFTGTTVQIFTCFTSTKVQIKWLGSEVTIKGAQCTCFTSTKLQTLTQKTLLGSEVAIKCNQFTFFTSSKKYKY